MSMYRAINGAQRAIRYFHEDVNVRRAPAGSYVDGKWVQGSSTIVPIKAAIQPITGENLQRIAEGRNIKYAISIYTNDTLKGADISSKTQPDIIEWDSKLFEVDKVGNWNGIIEATAIVVE